MCNIELCKASCCYNAPMDKSLFRIYKAHIQRPILRYEEQNQIDENSKMVVAITDEDWRKNKCPFLTDRHRCAIYDKRPNICRWFGNPPKGMTSKFLQCGWLNGKECDNNIDNEQDIVEGLPDLLTMIKMRL